jgi:lysozyme
MITAAITPVITGIDARVAQADSLPGPAPRSGQPSAPQVERQTDGMMPAGSPDATWVVSAPSSRTSAATTTTATFALGTDVASYQHPGGQPIDWPAVAASGQSFTIVKATESTSYTNPYAMTDVTGARGAGLVVGLYHFADPAVSATAQADYFARQVNGVGGTLLPPALDLEVTGGLSSAALITWTNAFLTRLQQDTGRIPMIYTGPYFWSSRMAGSRAFARYPLWEAHWTTAAQPQQVGGWPTWTLWQYSNGTYGSPPPVPGIPARVDRSRFAGTKAQLASLAATSRPGIQPPFTGTATATQFPDSTFVQVTGDSYVYEIVGRAPLFVTSWSRVGGRHPVRQISRAAFYTLRSSPLDGTFVVDSDRHAYRVTGGAPVFVTTWKAYGGTPLYVSIDAWDILHAGGSGPYSHLSSMVRDGTFVKGAETGQVYEVAGGAPLFVSTWSTFGGIQPYVVVNQAAIENAGAGGWWDHLRFVPADGTELSDGSTGALYLVTSGHPSPTGATTAAPAPFTLVGDTAIVNAGGTGVWAHLL